MYNVSDSYRTMMSASYLQSRISGIITFSSGSQITLDDSNIIKGSLTINNKAVNNSDFSLGSVYVGECQFTIYNTTISRYSLYGAKVELSYFLTLEDNSEEEIPLGVFYVDTPVRTKKLIQLKCYDVMTKFDINVEEDTWGSPYALLTLACDRCGVELGNTEEEITAMCNGTKDFTLQQSKVGTYRDLLSYISMILCGYATINRSGLLEIRQFHQTADLTISATKRTDSTIHDYETYFKSVTARFIAEQNYYPYAETDEEMDSGLQLNMGDIPIVQGLEEFKHGVLSDILTVLKGIRYVPSEFSIVSDPSIDLGDGLTLEKINDGTDDVFVVVTALTWSYHKEESIVSNGSDALLSNVSDQKQKQIDSMESHIESKNLVVKTYTNSEEYDIRSTEETIIRMSWSAFEDTTAIFFATIPIELDLDGDLVLNIYQSLELVGTLTKHLSRGKHFVTFIRYIPSEMSEHITLIIKAHLEYFESDNRKQEAKILSIKDWIDNQTSEFTYEYVEQDVDTTIPSGIINAKDIKAVVFAQGLNATEAWDGTLDITEEIGLINLDFNVLSDISENLQTDSNTPTRSNLGDTVGLISLREFGVYSFTDAIVENIVMISQTVEFSTNDYTEEVDGVLKLKTEYNYNSTDRTIDEGQMVGVEVITTDKLSVKGIQVVNV